MGHDYQPLDIDVQALMRGLVHELRNPLSAILTASSLLPGTQGLDEETEMLLDVVTKESKRMNRILTEFSTFAKPPKPHIETVNLAVMAREAARSDVKADVPIVLHDELPEHIWVSADPQLTSQALQNICENAREAMPEGGHLRLRSGENQGKVWLEVTDSGAGLSQNALANAFQPFYSNKGSSTGLGLSIARVALRASGGDCRIENAHDGGPKGATVMVELPLAQSHSAGQTEENAELQTA